MGFTLITAVIFVNDKNQYTVWSMM